MNSPMKPIPEHAKKVFTGLIYEVWQWEQELYDGSKTTFERLKRADYAFLVAADENRKIIMAEDEQPDRGMILTPPGGKVEAGEEPIEAAAREFTEETGYEAKGIKPWFSYRPAGKIEMNVHGYISSLAQKTSSQNLEAGEKIKLKFYSFDDFVELGQNEEVRDWMMRIKLLEAQLNSVKKEELKQLLYG